MTREPSPVLDDWLACPECDSRDLVIDYVGADDGSDKYRCKQCGHSTWR